MRICSALAFSLIWRGEKSPVRDRPRPPPDRVCEDGDSDRGRDIRGPKRATSSNKLRRLRMLLLTSDLTRWCPRVTNLHRKIVRAEEDSIKQDNKQDKKRQLSAHWIRRVSVESLTDPATVKRYLDRRPIRPMTELRIRTALERLGLGRLVKASADAG